MKSIVSSYITSIALVLSTLYVLCLPAASETAPCADPPGGAITCETGQVAICTVKAGKVDGRCITPPANKSGVELKAFLLSDLTGKGVSAEDVNKTQYKDALRQGRLETTDGAVVNFTIPKELLKPKESLR